MVLPLFVCLSEATNNKLNKENHSTQKLINHTYMTTVKFKTRTSKANQTN